jgi:hypothetical protein
MARRPTHYCSKCENTVYSDAVHSCYDAALVRTVREWEVRVADAAEAATYWRLQVASASDATTRETATAHLRTADATLADEVQGLWRARGYPFTPRPPA